MSGPGLAARDVGADVLDEVPLLLQQVLLVGRDEQRGVALDHRHEAAQVLEVHVQGLGQVVVEILHLLFKSLKEDPEKINMKNNGSS